MQYNNEIPPTTRPHQPIVTVLRYIPIPPRILSKILSVLPSTSELMCEYRKAELDSTKMKIGTEIARFFTTFVEALSPDEQFAMSGHLLPTHPDGKTCGYGPTLENEASK